MNEPTNFCHGECPPDSNYPDVDQNLEYINNNHSPNNVKQVGNVRLEEQTLPPNLLHYGKLLHLDTHNLHGMMEMKATYLALYKSLKIK